MGRHETRCRTIYPPPDRIRAWHTWAFLAPAAFPCLLHLPVVGGVYLRTLRACRHRQRRFFGSGAL